MTATKKLTSFSVCLQCVFAFTIGSRKLLKGIALFAAPGPRLAWVKRQFGATWSLRVGTGALL
jgi:hypothetical protein